MAIEPTPKAPEVENFLTRTFGFDRRETITALKCVPVPIGCGKELKDTAFAQSTGGDGLFRDRTSRDEFRISGMCQDCQDSVFGGEDI